MALGSLKGQCLEMTPETAAPSTTHSSVPSWAHLSYYEVIYGSKRVKISGLILAASMKNSQTVLHKRWHWQVAAIQMSGWIIYHCYLQLELQPGLPILPSQILSQPWVVISQLKAESHWMKLFDIWLYSFNVLTSLQKYCHENTFIKSVKSTFCPDIIKPLLFCADL